MDDNKKDNVVNIGDYSKRFHGPWTITKRNGEITVEHREDDHVIFMGKDGGMSLITTDRVSARGEEGIVFNGVLMEGQEIMIPAGLKKVIKFDKEGAVVNVSISKDDEEKN